MASKTVAAVTAVLTGLTFAGTLPTTAPVLGTIFALAAVTALFGGDPRRVLGVVTGLIDTITTTVTEVTDDVVDEKD